VGHRRDDPQDFERGESVGDGETTWKDWSQQGIRLQLVYVVARPSESFIGDPSRLTLFRFGVLVDGKS